MSNETTRGITIKELKEFLNNLPEKFDNCAMVNGEVAGLEGEYYVRIDKPVIHLEIDEATEEFLLLHQSEEEIDNIVKSAHGDSEGVK